MLFYTFPLLALLATHVVRAQLDSEGENYVAAEMGVLGVHQLSQMVGWVGPAATHKLQRRTKTATRTSPTQPPATGRFHQLVPRATTTTSSTQSCAPKYSAKTMITGTGTLPKPTTFVKKSGLGLTLDGKAFKMVGTNIYWLCQNEDSFPKGAITDKGQIREGLAIAVAMGGNTVRITSCGTSVGNSNSVEETLGNFTTNWDTRDYVIYAAGQYGLRVILPLTDDYDYYHGGKYTFLRWENVTLSNNGNQFWSNLRVKKDFKNYIKTLMQRTNSYNGLRYCDDPTIAAWETGNELGAYQGNEGYPPASWTTDITAAIKAYAPLQLIIDGSDGFYNPNTKAKAPGLKVANVDMMTDHSYPRNKALLATEVSLAKAAQKAFFIGEYDWTPQSVHGGDDLAVFINFVEDPANNIVGDLVWSVYGHDSQCCAFVPHNDGYTIYWPNGNDAASQAALLQVTKHFYRTRKMKVPSALPGVTCPQPVF